MTIYKALKIMRDLSGRGESFSFSFMSYNPTKRISEGVVFVKNGRLRGRESSKTENSDIIEAYIDLDTMQNRRFYQPLLMTFNGIKLTVNE